MNKRTIGGEKEALAAEYLRGQGLSIIQYNYRNRIGEIDLVARDGDTLVFVEVKYRRTSKAGHPEEAVSATKVRNICKVANQYRSYARVADNVQIRFDVVAIEGEEIRWHKDAFQYTY